MFISVLWLWTGCCLYLNRTGSIEESNPQDAPPTSRMPGRSLWTPWCLGGAGPEPWHGNGWTSTLGLPCGGYHLSLEFKGNHSPSAWNSWIKVGIHIKYWRNRTDLHTELKACQTLGYHLIWHSFDRFLSETKMGRPTNAPIFWTSLGRNQRAFISFQCFMKHPLCWFLNEWVTRSNFNTTDWLTVNHYWW